MASGPLVDGELDLTGYPPPPVVWLSGLMDTFCIPLQCTAWRDAVGVSEDSWFSYQYKLPAIIESKPSFPSFPEYLSELSSEDSSSVIRMMSPQQLLQSLRQYAFETSSTALGDLTTPTAFFTLIALLFVLRTIKSVLMPLFRSMGRQAGRRTHGAAWEATNEVRIAKFGEYVFRLLYHTSISAYGVWYFYDKEWWADNSQGNATRTLFSGFPYHDVEPGMAWYYLLQAAYNLDAMISLLELSFEVQVRGIRSAKGTWQSPVCVSWSKTCRGDFQEMFIHHVVTNLLVFGSSMCRLTRIGSMVFLVHDISDIPVDLSKLANFLKWKVTTLTCFISMVLVWMATRLYVLPVTIYGAVLTQSHLILEEGLSPVLYICYRHIFYVLIGLLILLHVAWFVMFLRMFKTFLVKNECHDLSEHKKGEAQHVHGKQQHYSNGSSSNGVASSRRVRNKVQSKMFKSTSYLPAAYDGHADEKKEE